MTYGGTPRSRAIWSRTARSLSKRPRSTSCHDSVSARERVRGLQRRYVELWADRLREVHADLTSKRARAMAHAAFGMLNSTPHSAMLPEPEMSEMLQRMTLDALGVSGPGAVGGGS